MDRIISATVFTGRLGGRVCFISKSLTVSKLLNQLNGFIEAILIRVAMDLKPSGFLFEFILDCYLLLTGIYTVLLKEYI